MPPESLQRTRLVVLPRQAGPRLDQWLAALTSLSRREVRRRVAAGEVRRDGEVSRILSRPVAAGEVVEVAAPAAELGVPAEPAVDRPTILHEDAFLVAVDKPSGVLSQPAERQRPGELALDERLLVTLALRQGRRPFLRLVHRLDRPTSGVVLFARCPEALPPLARAWREGRVERLYLALVEGVPGFGERLVEAPLARVPGGAWRFCVAPAGRPATTAVRLLAAGGGRALVECRLETGRTHQVRVHLAHLGFPVVGDRLYGAAAAGASRLLLHAAEVGLPHPEGEPGSGTGSGRRLVVRAPLPDDFAAHLEGLDVAAPGRGR